jgi:microcystin-dependent protein
VNWALASGQLIPITQNATLYNLIGTTYGGNGVSTFALPNIQGRMPMHMGAATGLTLRTLGQMGGAESATFPTVQVPSAPQAPIEAIASTSPAIGSISPFLVVNFIISLFGVFPTQT